MEGLQRMTLEKRCIHLYEIAALWFPHLLTSGEIDLDKIIAISGRIPAKKVSLSEDYMA